MFSIIQAAGWPIWPLILCSIVALALIIERLVSLRSQRVAPPRLLDEVISVTRASLPNADVVNKLADNSVLGRVFAAGLRAVIADPRLNEDGLRMAFESAGRAAVHRLERYLNALGTIASAAPLLGLFGTVVGMIQM
ncbi:MAG TPA: MotA/TolQ/ExbB proton channel family protein, partial [Ideonella sp.]|nr:MotA/TolQ/ExbB proton channel family protein [Ideonella sp.]